MIENKENLTKYYSQKAIAIATYFGGPLAAGILAGQNFRNQGKKEYGKYSIIIGIISTLLLFIGIFLIPENIISKVPNALIPLVYTGIIYLIIEKFQGKVLEEHKNNERKFYSLWKASGIGAICMTILLAGVLAYAFLSPNDFDANKYDIGIASITKNEEKALELFDLLENQFNSEKGISFIDSIGIPLWKTNIQILDSLDKIEGLYAQFKKQNQILKEYSKLRIKSYKLVKIALIGNTNIYDKEIEQINIQIENEISKLE